MSIVINSGAISSALAPASKEDSRTIHSRPSLLGIDSICCAAGVWLSRMLSTRTVIRV